MPLKRSVIIFKMKYSWKVRPSCNEAECTFNPFPLEWAPRAATPPEARATWWEGECRGHSSSRTRARLSPWRFVAKFKWKSTVTCSPPPRCVPTPEPASSRRPRWVHAGEDEWFWLAERPLFSRDWTKLVVIWFQLSHCHHVLETNATIPRVLSWLWGVLFGWRC